MLPPQSRSRAALLTSLFAVGCLVFIYFTFTLVDHTRIDQLLDIPSSPYVEIIVPENHETWPYRVYKSSPVRPPNISINTYGGELAEGFLFLTPKGRGRQGVNQTAPFAFDSDGELVFAANATYGTTDFRVQTYRAQQHLTYWQGKSTGSPNPGHGYGVVTFLDSEYEEFNLSVKADINGIEDVDTEKKPGPAPGTIDIHEHDMTDRDTLLVTAYNNTPANLSSMGGPEAGWIADSLFFEIDVATQDIIYRWSPLEHIPLNSSRLPVKSYMGSGTRSAPWDFFHTNSIQAIGSEYFLISSRHTWSIWLIARHTGEVVCEFNGEDGGTFGAVPEGGHFRWQHHARAHNVTDTGFYLSLFDNHAMIQDPDSKRSSGLMFYFALPPQRHQPPKLVKHLKVKGSHVKAPSQGSYQADVGRAKTQVLGYGQMPLTREFGPEGELRMEAQYGYHDYVQSFRAFKQVWHATPKAWGPSLVLEEAGGKGDEERRIRAYVSWNGATDVESWHVFVVQKESGHAANGVRTPKEQASAVEEDGHERFVGKAAKLGFETVFELRVEESECVQVAAVRDGVALKRSEVVCLP
ncbi:hypothetical protein B0A50_03473 [Salinomyces thailandicus]|uniref:ASST-domain-containing protein n=1 Tax=Salinomyces thailandicus TaxID=706561 RepID=A0A4U0U361_9PEZI|nr:hypothetical protein B0A50_03473 [Salinomyces thailandica]